LGVVAAAQSRPTGGNDVLMVIGLLIAISLPTLVGLLMLAKQSTLQPPEDSNSPYIGS
jgi:hypothetical protein